MRWFPQGLHWCLEPQAEISPAWNQEISANPRDCPRDSRHTGACPGPLLFFSSHSWEARDLSSRILFLMARHRPAARRDVGALGGLGLLHLGGGGHWSQISLNTEKTDNAGCRTQICQGRISTPPFPWMRCLFRNLWGAKQKAGAGPGWAVERLNHSGTATADFLLFRKIGFCWDCKWPRRLGGFGWHLRHWGKTILQPPAISLFTSQ